MLDSEEMSKKKISNTGRKAREKAALCKKITYGKQSFLVCDTSETGTYPGIF